MGVRADGTSCPRLGESDFKLGGAQGYNWNFALEECEVHRPRLHEDGWRAISGRNHGGDVSSHAECAPLNTNASRHTYVTPRLFSSAST